MAINTLYMDKAIIESASGIYNRQSPKNIRLGNFFQKSVFSLLQRKLHSSRFVLKFNPYKYKYSVTSMNAIDSFLNGGYFNYLVMGILGMKKYKIIYEIRKFEAGNYTLLHDAEKEKEGIDFFLDFSKSRQNFGGYTTYLTKEEELLILTPSPNTLSFIERRNELMKFTKYVQHRQKHPIFHVAGVITKK